MTQARVGLAGSSTVRFARVALVLAAASFFACAPPLQNGGVELHEGAAARLAVFCRYGTYDPSLCGAPPADDEDPASAGGAPAATDDAPAPDDVPADASATPSDSAASAPPDPAVSIDEPASTSATVSAETPASTAAPVSAAPAPGAAAQPASPR